MNENDAIEFVRVYVSPEEVWPNALIFDNDYDIETYMEDHGWHDSMYCEWEGIAEEAGWVNPEFSSLKDLVDQSEIERKHDDDNHSGAVRWCKEGACGL